MYNKSVYRQQYGYAAAVGLVLFAVSLILTLLTLKLVSDVNEQNDECDGTSQVEAGCPRLAQGSFQTSLHDACCVTMFVPFIMMLSIALKDKKQIVYDFFSFSGPYHWENYKAAFSAISPYLFNTVFHGGLHNGTLCIAGDACRVRVCEAEVSAAQAVVWHYFYQDDAAGRSESDPILHACDEAWNSRYLSACHSVRRGY